MSDYLKFWKVDRQIFGFEDALKDFYLSETLLPLVQRIQFFCQQGSPLILVSGAEGTGKTALTEYLQQSLPPQTHDVLSWQMVEQNDESTWLWDRIANYFGHSGDLQANKHEATNVFLACLDELIEEKRKILLIVDDAHFLHGSKSTEGIELLLSFHARAKSSFSFILFANNSLEEMPAFANLRRFSILNSNLPDWNDAECSNFVKNRLNAAGLPENTFEKAALRELFSLSSGRIAKLALYCENAMLEAFLKGKHFVDKHAVQSAASYLDTDPIKNHHQPPGQGGKQIHPRPEVESSIRLQDLVKNPKRTG